MQVYDHISQGSPNLLSPERETYRRAAAVTAVREGSNDHVPYLYTLNFACPSETWDDMEPMFRKVSPLHVPRQCVVRPAAMRQLCCTVLIGQLCAGRVLVQVDVARRRVCGTGSAVMALLLNLLQIRTQRIALPTWAASASHVQLLAA